MLALPLALTTFANVFGVVACVCFDVVGVGTIGSFALEPTAPRVSTLTFPALMILVALELALALMAMVVVVGIEIVPVGGVVATELEPKSGSASVPKGSVLLRAVWWFHR